MHRVLVVALAALALAGGAHAAPADAPDGDLDEPLPAEAKGAAEAAATATATAASGAGSAASGLASQLADAAGVVGDAALDAAAALADGVAAAASASVDLAAAGASGVAGALSSAGSLLAGAAASAGALAVAGAAAAAATAADLALALASASLDLVQRMAADLAASPSGRREAAVRGIAGGTSGAAAWSAYRSALRRGVLAPLYSRISPDELLDHDVRRAIYDYVGEHPGAHVSEIADAVDVGWGTAVYHLERMASAEILVSENGGNHRCFFQNGGISEEAREAVPALKSDTAREVLGFVRENPAASQKEVAEALDMSAALVSWHVSRLAESGLVEKRREGRGNALYVDDEMAAPALKAATRAATA